MVLTYLARGDKEKFCLDSLELLWIIHSASSLAKENTGVMRNAYKVKKVKKENAATVPSMAQTLL